MPIEGQENKAPVVEAQQEGEGSRQKVLDQFNKAEQQPNGLQDTAKDLQGKVEKFKILIPALATANLRMNTEDKKETLEKGELLPESTFTVALSKYIPKPPKVTTEQITQTGLEQGEVQNIINNIIKLQDSPEGNKDVVTKLQKEILDNPNGINYYPNGKHTSGDGGFGPTTGLALLNFLGADESLKNEYKKDVIQKGVNPKAFIA